MSRENMRRHDRAKKALRPYLTFDEDSALRDLLADLRHYCDVEGLNFAEQDRIAYSNYVEELE